MNSTQNKSELIDEVLDLAGFQIFPAGANKDRLKAKATLQKAFREVEIEGRIEEVRALMEEHQICEIEAGHKTDCMQRSFSFRLSELTRIKEKE